MNSFSPMLAELADQPFSDSQWVFETKWDGYRALAFVDYGKVELLSRNQQDFTETYPGIVRSLQKINHEAVIDGEIVAVDVEGRSRFQLLQDYQRDKSTPISFAVFDLLFLDGKDLRNTPLIERKKMLKRIFPSEKNLVFTHHIIGKGEELFRLAKEQGMEGVMAKRADSLYVSGRSSQWLKVKSVLTTEAVIAGFTSPRGSRQHFGALILGVYGDDKQLRYIGHTGGGFTDASLKEVSRKLKPLIIKKSPFFVEPETNAPAAWVKPQLVCEVKFHEWTKDGQLRQPVFTKLRPDKDAREVGIERTQPTTLKKGEFKNTDKVFWPKDGYTKGDLIEYYNKIADIILPHLRDRPQSLNRYPDGINGLSFFQKDLRSHPDWIKTVELRSDTEEKDIEWLLCNDKDTLLYMANLGCIELNPWISRYQKPDYPDYLLLDLDPHGVEFSAAVTAAIEVKKLLDEIQIDSFLKTSGKRGLHVLIPLGAQYTFEQSRQFAEILANVLFQRLPETTSVARSPQKREHKVYLDFLQNRSGQTMAAAYCVRPIEGAPVSTPIDWRELKADLHPTDFTMKTIWPRLKKVGDLWLPLLKHKGIDMADCLDRLVPEQS